MSLRTGSNLKPRARAIPRKLAAGQGEGVIVAGSFVYVYAADGPIAVDFGNGDVPVVSGDFFDFRGDEFDSFRITDLSGAENNVTLLVTTGNFGRKEVTGSFTPTRAANTESTEDATLVGGAAEQIAAAKSARRTITVRALSTNAGITRIGDDNVSATRGIPLLPNEYFTFENTDAIFAFGTAGDKIAIIEETN